MRDYGEDEYDLDDDIGLSLTGALWKNINRSKRARQTDGRRQAEVTTDYEEWSENPDEFDFKGVDEKSGLWD